jgi:hypothetical protein
LSKKDIAWEAEYVALGIQSGALTHIKNNLLHFIHIAVELNRTECALCALNRLRRLANHPQPRELMNCDRKLPGADKCPGLTKN